MLVLAILTFLPAVALTQFRLTSLLLIRSTSLVLIASAVIAFNTVNIIALNTNLALWNGLFQITLSTQWIEIFICLVGSQIIVLWAPQTLKNIQTPNSAFPFSITYSLFILFTLTGSSFLISSIDLISFYLSIELQSFSVYLLATLYRDSKSSTEAGLLYFLLGGLSSCFILLGSALVYSETGLTNLDWISDYYGTGNLNGSEIIIMLLIFSGIFFKISAAPFHQWAPDVYDRVPTIVTTWLTIIPKISLLTFSLHFRINLISINQNQWITLIYFILICSVLSLIIGSLLGLDQTRLKRLLAYSTISHIGFILLALANNSETGVKSFLFYLIQYSILNLLIFSVILGYGYWLKSEKKTWKNSQWDIENLNELSGTLNLNPLLSLSIAVGLFSIAGVPPLIGFFAKQQVLLASIHSNYYWIGFIAIITSVISASYYLKIVRLILFEKNPIMKISYSQTITQYHSFIISSMTLITLFFIVSPNLILDSINLLALTLILN